MPASKRGSHSSTAGSHSGDVFCFWSYARRLFLRWRLMCQHK